MRNYRVAPSLMCMDFLHMEEQLRVFNHHADLLHFDIMDGHYCKNLSLCPDILRQVRTASEIPIDVHLMVERPEDFVDAVLAGGADFVSLHSDRIEKTAFRLLHQIKGAGRGFGVVLHPATPLEAVGEYLRHVDMLTIMTVDIGFAGQKFIGEMLRKIEEAARLKAEHGYTYTIQVDGAVNRESIPGLAAAGTECYIVGTSGLFSLDDNLETACGMVRGQIERALCECPGQSVQLG